MQKLLEFYKQVRQYSINLCKPLEIEDYVPQSADYTSPPKWHLAHSTWFFERMILQEIDTNYKVFNTDYDFLFNSYYQALGDKIVRGNRGLCTRPTVKDVLQYREYVDAHLIKLIKNGVDTNLESLIILGLNHEQQHQELLISDLKYTFACNPIFPVYATDFNLVKDKNQETGWHTVNEGVYSIGVDNKSKEFCYDNEKGQHKVYINTFEISKALVTNGEFLEFINDGAYSNFNYWLDEGYAWLQENNVNAPLHWHKIDGEWMQYTLAGLQKIDPDAILCHISFYEAMAYASYKKMRLATEFEWEVAADTLNWGQRWEWCNSAYLPYPNFKIAEGAVGEYNGKFMVSQMVLRGASVATSAGHSRKTYRNFFHPKYQWQFTGIRLVK